MKSGARITTSRALASRSRYQAGRGVRAKLLGHKVIPETFIRRIGSAYDRVARILAPFMPSAVINADALPVHEPRVEKSKRGAPARATVKNDRLIRPYPFCIPQTTDIGNRLHPAVRVVELAHAIDIVI